MLFGKVCVGDFSPASSSCGVVAPVPKACLMVLVVQPDLCGIEERRSVRMEFAGCKCRHCALWWRLKWVVVGR